MLRIRCLVPILILGVLGRAQSDPLSKMFTQAAHSLPAGFSIAAKNGDLGQAITGPVTGSTTKRAFTGMLRELGPYFDAMPALQGAFSDPQERQIQAFFKASYHGVPVRGLMVVTAQGGKGSAAILFDRAESFAKSLPVLSKGLSKGLAGQTSAAPAAPPELTKTRLPDGSGWIGLPSGWKILGAYKGAVDILGPNGESMALGTSQHVFQRGRPGSPFMYGEYRPPWQAWQLRIDFLNKGALSRGESSLRLVEHAPSQSNAGTAEWLAYELIGGGAKYRGLAYVITKPFHDDLGSWFVYASHMNAPAARWPQAMPAMWTIWKSWSVNPAVFRERMDSALQSMRETTQLILDANKYRIHSFANTNYGEDEVIRGVTMIEDVTTHARAEVDTNQVGWWIGELNRLGYNVRIVPTMELVP